MISPFKKITTTIKHPITVLDRQLSLDKYCSIDLSESNEELKSIEIIDPDSCQKYIDTIFKTRNAKVAYGGYLEKRDLYRDKANFSKPGINRNVHLGIDFWTKSGTNVITPVSGKVHSFKNNSTIGDYGPTIILKHEFEGFGFHSLYGHLSLESISNLNINQEFEAGSVLGTLGTPDVNVNYAPHLHFQIILDLEGYKGDYPGVCSEDMLDFYSKNSPNPNLLLKMPS